MLSKGNELEDFLGWIEITPSRKDVIKIWFDDKDYFEKALTQFKKLYEKNIDFIELDGSIFGIDFLKDCKIDFC